MLDDTKLFFNLVTRDALLIFDGQAHTLEGPFSSREDAERAGEELIERISSEESAVADQADMPSGLAGPLRAWRH